MVQVQCPKCASIVEGVPGKHAICGTCGFEAVLPVEAVAPVTAEPEPLPGLEAVRTPSVWAYMAAVAGLGTFFLADYVLPYLLAITGIGLGFMAHMQNRADHRGMLAMVIGCVALVACASFMAF